MVQHIGFTSMIDELIDQKINEEIHEAFASGVREFAEWCEKYHVRFDDYGIRTAADTIEEFYVWRNRQ